MCTEPVNVDEYVRMVSEMANEQWGEWCVVHRVHLVALVGLAILPIVDELNIVYTQLQNITFVRTMCTIRRHNKSEYGGIALTRVQKVCYFCIFIRPLSHTAEFDEMAFTSLETMSLFAAMAILSILGNRLSLHFRCLCVKNALFSSLNCSEYDTVDSLQPIDDDQKPMEAERPEQADNELVNGVLEMIGRVQAASHAESDV